MIIFFKEKRENLRLNKFKEQINFLLKEKIIIKRSRGFY
jgi:hypothetical protein